MMYPEDHYNRPCRTGEPSVFSRPNPCFSVFIRGLHPWRSSDVVREAGAETVAAILRPVRIAEAEAGAVGAEAPASAANHLQPGAALGAGIGDAAGGIGAMIVARPFPDVARHVEQAERIRRIAADRLGPFAIVVRARGRNRTARAVGLASAGAAGIFPLRLRRQPEPGPRAGGIETLKKGLYVQIGDALDRAARAVCEVRGIAAHDPRPLALRDFVDPHIKGARQGHEVELLLGLAPRLGGWSSHLERSRRDAGEDHSGQRIGPV